MVWTTTAAWRREAYRGATPVWRLTVDPDPVVILEVVNYAAAIAGDDVTVNATQNRSIVNGTDFTAAGSNAATATAIAVAWNFDIDRVTAVGVRAISYGTRVYFVRFNNSLPFTVTSSNPSAWAVSTIGTNLFPPLVSCDAAFDGATSTAYTQVPIISEIKGIEWKLDPVSRKVTGPNLEITVIDDGTVRTWMRLFSMVARRATLEFGFRGLADADYCDLPTFWIEDIIPRRGHFIIALVDSAGVSWRDQQVTGRWVAWHPLQVIQDILIKAGATDGVHYDSATLNPTIDADRSHFVISRYDDQEADVRLGVDEPTPAGELIDELLTIMQGTWRPSQTGVYQFAPLSYTASPVRTLAIGPDTGDDVDDIEQIDTLKNVITKCRISFGKRSDGFEYEHLTRHQHAELEHIYNAQSVAGAGDDLTIDLKFMNGIGLVGEAFNFTQGGGFEVTDTQFDVTYAGRKGFCGARFTYPGGPDVFLADGCTMGTGTNRYAVIGFVYPSRYVDGSVGYRTNTPGGPPDGVNETEAVLVDSWNGPGGHQDDEGVRAGPAGAWIPSPYALTAHITANSAATVLPNGYTIGQWFGAGLSPDPPGRGALGTIAPYFWFGDSYGYNGYPDRILDLTIPFYIAKGIVQRFGYGAPRVRFSTPIRHADLEIGDVIAFSEDDFLIGFLFSTASVNTTYEITSKRIVVGGGSSTRVEYEATFIRNPDQQVPFSTVWTPPAVSIPGIDIISEVVTDGGVIVTDSGSAIYG